jgi:hypothetical protein
LVKGVGELTLEGPEVGLLNIQVRLKHQNKNVIHS